MKELVIVYDILNILLNAYSYVIIIYCLFSFIPQMFHSPIGYRIYIFIYKLAKPAFDLVHMLIPNRFLTIGMINLTPIIILLGIHLMQLGLYQVFKMLLNN